MAYFNPRSREGSDRGERRGRQGGRDFNPCSREGSDGFVYSSARSLSFQSTLPRRERHDAALGNVKNPEFQSTLPRRERRRFAVACGRCAGISIHAPAKGATLAYVRVSTEEQFQSTLPRRERQLLQSRLSCARYFNPRSREGSDAQPFQIIHPHFDISIHAPAKGATSSSIAKSVAMRHFNPRSREGSDSKNHQDYSQ